MRLIRYLLSLGTILLAFASPILAADYRSEFPPQYTDTPMGVNLQTGRFRYWPYSFSLGPFVLERGFNKAGFQFLGLSYWRTYQAASGGAQLVFTVTLGDQKMDFFRGSNGNYIWWSASSVGWRLQRSGAGHLLTSKSGDTYFYADHGGTSGYSTPKGRVTQVTYADGSRIDIAYDAQSRPQFLESNLGYAVRYEYLNGGAQLAVCGFNRTTSFANATTSCSSSSYKIALNNTLLNSTACKQASGYIHPYVITTSQTCLRIDSVLDLMGKTSTLTYQNSFLQCMTLPNSNTCEFNNIYGPQVGEAPQATKADQVRVQTDANGNGFTYGYDFPLPGDDAPPPYPGGPPVISTSWMNGPGYSAQGNYENGLLKQLSAPQPGPVYFDYDGIVLLRARWVEGNYLTITRDWAGNAYLTVETPKQGSGQSPLTSTQTFPYINLYGNPTLCQAASDKLCDKPTTRVDYKGNQTDITYDAAHGGMLTLTLPADANGVRPQTRYEYAQRYAMVKTSGGTIVQASAPIWIKTRERMCRTTAASGQSCAGGVADEVITDFEYGPTTGANNLLLRGVAVTADGQTLRTCYAYDALGRKVSETKPLGTSGTCP